MGKKAKGEEGDDDLVVVVVVVVVVEEGSAVPLLVLELAAALGWEAGRSSAA